MSLKIGAETVGRVKIGSELVGVMKIGTEIVYRSVAGPPAPRVIFRTINSGRFVVSWSISGYTGPTITGWDVEFLRADNSIWFSRTATATQSLFDLSIDNWAATLHSVRVRARTADTVGEWGSSR